MKKYNRRSGFGHHNLMIPVAIIGILAGIAIPNFIHLWQENKAHGKFGNESGVIEALKEGALGETIAARAAKEGFVLERLATDDLSHAVYSMTDNNGVCSIIVDQDKLHVLCLATASDFQLDEQGGEQILRYTHGKNNGIYVVGEGVRVTEPEKLPAVKFIDPAKSAKDK